MSIIEKLWRCLIKSLIYILTPLLIFYAVCFVVATFTHNGVLWNVLEIPTAFYDLSVKVYGIGAIPMVGTLVILLIQLANIAFKTNKNQEKNSLNLAVLEQKIDAILRTQKSLCNVTNELQKANVNITEEECVKLTNDLNNAIDLIEKQLSSSIDFENLDIESIKKQLLALEDMGKSIQGFINNNIK